MKKHNSTRWLASVVCSILLLALVTPGLLFAKSDSGESSDRKLAKAVATQLALAIEEGQRFAAARDALAKSRLRGMQSLEESLVEGNEANQLQVRAWEAIGAENSKRLYESVLAATQDAVLQEQQRAERRSQQLQAIANQESAVKLRTSDLMGVASSLAALSQPPSRKGSAELFDSLVQQLRPDIRDGTAVAVIGAALNERSVGDLLLESLAERKKAAKRNEEAGASE